MYKFGEKSLAVLEDVHPDLRGVLEEALRHIDFSVLEGFRSEPRQTEMFREGKSRLTWPDSQHNQKPSKAVDLAPYPLDWDDQNRFCYLAGIVIAIGAFRGVKLRWGGDWDMRGFMDPSKKHLRDLGHFEMVEV